MKSNGHLFHRPRLRPMANEEHALLIKNGPSAVGEWRAQHPDEKLDLSGLELNRKDLSGFDLRHVDFTGASLGQVRFLHAKLDHANFTKATCNGAKFDDASLEEALFQNANLGRSSFSRANCRAARFISTEIGEAVFQGCNLEKAQFLDCGAANAQFTQVTGSETLFERGTWTGVNLSGCHLIKPRLPANLESAKFLDARLPGVAFTNLRLSHAEFDGAFLQKADFSHSSLQNASLRNCDVSGADFREAELARCDVYGLVGAEAARHLETTRIPREHDARYFENCVRNWPERWPADWESLRVFGRLPLFGVSYAVLVIVPLLLYFQAMYNEKVEIARGWAERVEESGETSAWRPWTLLAKSIRERLHEVPVDSQSALLLGSTFLLAVASTIYLIGCPSRIKEFTRDQWCDQIGRSLVHYWPESWRRRYVRLVCLACYVLGGIGVGWVLLIKVGRAAAFVWEHSRFSFL